VDDDGSVPYEIKLGTVLHLQPGEDIHPIANYGYLTFIKQLLATQGTNSTGPA